MSDDPRLKRAFDAWWSRFEARTLPEYVQTPEGIAILRELHKRLGRVLEDAGELEVLVKYRAKWCSKPCCRGKPHEERHGPYAVAEWWDTSGGKGRWRTVPKTLQSARTREERLAVLQVERDIRGARGAAGAPSDATAEPPRPATSEENAALRRHLV